MNKSLLHTPEGVRDVYGEEYARTLFVEKKLHDRHDAVFPAV